MRRFYILLIFLLIYTAATGQSFYVITSTNQLKKVTITNTGAVTSVDINSCGNFMLGSIAINKNTLYSVSGGQLVQGTISGTSIVNCSQLSVVTPSGDSLTADSTGVLYMNSGAVLCSVDPKNPVVKKLGTMPYNPAGDFIFYKGSLYMASTVGIVKVDVNNPSNSTLVISGLGYVYGLAAMAVSGSQIKVYATVINGNSTNIVELDMDNYLTQQTVATLPYIVYDAASDVERGVIPQIQIDSVTQINHCPYNGTMDVQVICEDPLSDYQYILNHTISSTTGAFSGVTPGVYDLKIITALQTKDTTITVNTPVIVKPTLTTAKVDENCDQAGKISFSTNSNGSLYTIRLNLSSYPLSHVFTALTAGSYHFSVVNQIGCVVDTFSVTIGRVKCAIGALDVTINKECTDLNRSDIQVGTTTHVTASNTYTFNGITNTTGTFRMIDPGTYKLNVSTSENVSKDTTIVIPDQYLKKPLLNYTRVDQVCEAAGSVTIIVQPADSAYNIKASSGTFPSGHRFANLNAGSYSFSVLNRQGCLLDTLTVNINFDKCDPVVFPNTFTPNNDGINDAFLPVQGAIASNFKLTVYNRYGSLMFSSASMSVGWDGTYKGKAVPVGTYYWIALYYDQNNIYRTQSGSVSLIR